MWKGILACLLLAASGITARAEVGPSTTKELFNYAEVVVTGQVKHVYSALEQSANGRGTDMRYTIELQVSHVQKKDRDLANPLFAKGWEAKSRPPNQVGASGHYFVWKNQTYRLDSLPKGAQVTLYLDRKEDGSLELVLPNGLQYHE